MKLTDLAICALLPLFATSRVLLPLVTTNVTSLLPFDRPIAVSRPSPVHIAGDTPASEPSIETFWEKYVCRGEKLHNACKVNKAEAARFVKPVDSPFEGTLEYELKRWGYYEFNEDAVSSCWFDGDLDHAFKALGIDPKSSDEGGPNECYKFLHYDQYLKVQGKLVPASDQTYAVDGRTYRATYGAATIGANPKDGLIYFIDVKSAVEGAKIAWRTSTTPSMDELPQLKQISDMAWGIWRRQHPDGQGLDKIKYFMVCFVVNYITTSLVDDALETYTLEPGQTRLKSVPKWPGITFSMDTEQGVAMLGSPNGIAVGYFLAQHKTQLGGNKYVTKVQLFLNDEGDHSPYMLFHVGDEPTVSSLDVHKPQPRGFGSIETISGSSSDGRHIIREHKSRARL